MKTLSFSPPSVINPTGTYIREPSSAPGNDEPQCWQKLVCQLCPGLCQVLISLRPFTQRKSLLLITITAIPLLPVARRQIEQWQINTSAILEAISKATCHHNLPPT